MLESITLQVIGEQRLFCDGCERRAEAVLKALEGVRQVRAQARNQRIEVWFDATTVDAAALVESLAKAGYQTRPGASASAEPG